MKQMPHIDRPLSTRVDVIDAQGVVIGGGAGVETALAIARSVTDKRPVAVVGSDGVLLARCSVGGTVASEPVANAAVKRWRQRQPATPQNLVSD